MADPIKKTAKEVVSEERDISPEIEEEYELMPHNEIVELREELRKMKALPPEAGAKAEASYDELTRRMDRLIEIFEEAEKTVKIEEGAASFKEKMAPVVEKMNMILKQNSEIAEGIVALADIMGEIKDKLEVGVIYKAKEAEKIRTEPIPSMPRAEPSFGPGQMEPMPDFGFGPMPLPRQPRAEEIQPPSMPPPLPRFGQMPPPGAAPAPGPMPPPPGMMAGQPRKKGLFGR